MADRRDDLDLNPDGGLSTLVDLRRPFAVGDSSHSAIAAVVRDPNDLRLERMLKREHLVYGVPTPFVGRRDALERLYNVVRDAVNRQQVRTVSLLGGPGVGKTRLLAELFALVDPVARGIEVLAAAASDGEAPDGLSVIGQLVRRRFKIEPHDRPGKAEDKIIEAIEPLVDARQLSTAARLIGFLAGLPTAGLGPEAQPDDLDRFQRRALKSFYNLARYDASQATWIIAIHRAQHLTPRAVSVLHEMIVELAQLPVIVIFLSDAPTPLELSSVSPAHCDIALEPLATKDAERLVRALLHKLPDVPQRLVDDVLSRSAGNPGLIEDNVRLLIQRGIVEPVEPTWRLHPDRMAGPMGLAGTVEASSRARVAALKPKLREVLEMASVFGPAFWFEGVLAILRTRPYDGDRPQAPWVNDRLETRLNNLLLEARRQDLVIFHTQTALEGQTEFSFVHREDRASLYEELDPERRALYHRMAAQWLSELELADPRPWYDVIGRHLEEGGRGEHAAEFYVEAARAAAAVYDLARAKQLFRHALGLVDVDRADILLDVLSGFGDASAASGDLQAARRIYGALLEASLIPKRAEVGASAWLRLGRTHRSLGDYQRAQPCYQNALALYRKIGDRAGIAAAQDHLAKLVWLQGAEGAWDEALRYFGEALEIRRALGDDAGIAESLTNIANIQLQRGDRPAAERGFTEALALRERAGDRAGQALSHIGLGAVRWARRDLDAAIEAWSAGLALAEEIGDRELIGIFLDNLGEAHLERGDLNAARKALEEARELTADTGDQRTAADVLRNLGALALARREFEVGLERVAEAEAICQAIGARPALGQVLRTKGEILSRQFFARSPHRVGDARAIDDCFERAMRLFEEVGDELELGLTLTAFARHMEQRGIQDVAQRLRDRAASLV